MHFTNKHTLLCCLIVAMLAFVKSHPLMDNQYLDDEQYEVPYQVYYGEINDEHVSCINYYIDSMNKYSLEFLCFSLQ